MSENGYDIFIEENLIAKGVPEPCLMLIVRGLLTKYDGVTISAARKETGNG